VRWRAVQEGILRSSLLCDGRYLDQALYSLLDIDWRRSRSLPPRVSTVHIH